MGVRALENRIRPSTQSIGVGLIRRTPGIAVSEAFLAFAASDCNGWARRWGFGTATRMAPNKSIRLVRVSSRARRIGYKAPSVRTWPLPLVIYTSQEQADGGAFRAASSSGSDREPSRLAAATRAKRRQKVQHPSPLSPAASRDGSRSGSLMQPCAFGTSSWRNIGT